MNPWWLRPPAEEGPTKGGKPDRGAAKTSGGDSSGKKPTKTTSDKSETRRTAAQGETKKAGSSRRSRRGRGGGRGRKAKGSGKRSDRPDRIVVLCDLPSTEESLRIASQDRLDIAQLLKRLSEKGKLSALRAYGDLDRYSSLAEDCRERGFELIDLAGQDDPGARVSLAVDAIDLCLLGGSCEVVALVSGTPDLMPLVSKLREQGKRVIGIGARSTGPADLAEKFDQYLDFADLEPQETEAEPAQEVEPSKAPLFDLLVDTIQSLEEGGEEIIWGSRLKREIHQRNPEFSEESHGYATFSDLLEEADRYEIIHLERDDRSGNYYVAGLPRE